MVRAQLLTMAKTWKRPKCLSTDGQINEMGCTHARALFSHEKERRVFVLFEIRVLLCSSGWPRTCYVAQGGLELTIFLPQPPKNWDYRCVSLCLAKKEWSSDKWSNMDEPLKHLLSERNQTQRTNTTWVHLHEISRIVKFIEMESRLEVSRV
jgi:hypothetical protein